MYVSPDSPEEYAALRSDIEMRRQVLIPVVNDQDRVSPQTICNIRKRLGVQCGQEEDEGEKKKAIVFVVNRSQMKGEEPFRFSHLQEFS